MTCTKVRLRYRPRTKYSVFLWLLLLLLSPLLVFKSLVVYHTTLLTLFSRWPHTRNPYRDRWGFRGYERCWMVVDKELSSRCTQTFMGHCGVTSLSTFKAKLLSHCSATVVYDIPFSSSEYILFIQCKKTQFELWRYEEREWKTKKESKRDGNPSRVLRACADQLAGVFTDVFNLSLS